MTSNNFLSANKQEDNCALFSGWSTYVHHIWPWLLRGLPASSTIHRIWPWWLRGFPASIPYSDQTVANARNVSPVKGIFIIFSLRRLSEHVPWTAAFKLSYIEISAKLEICYSWGPHLRSMQEPHPIWASYNPLLLIYFIFVGPSFDKGKSPEELLTIVK